MSDRLAEIEARANAATERHERVCDMGDDGGPCDQCLAIREFRSDVPYLLARIRELETALRSVMLAEPSDHQLVSDKCAWDADACVWCEGRAVLAAPVPASAATTKEDASRG